MRFSKFYCGGLITLLSFSCTTEDKTVKEVDTKLEKKGAVGGKTIGLNDDKEAIIQEETAVDDEMRRQEWVNNKLEEELNAEHLELQRCRDDLADPRLGGSGEVAEIPEVDNIKNPNEVKEELGITADGNLKMVKKEFLVDKIKSEKKYETSLTNLVKTVKKHNTQCGQKMARARVTAGLPAQRYKAEGTYDSKGNWTQTRKAEITLDDAFEIRAKEKGNSATAE